MTAGEGGMGKDANVESSFVIISKVMENDILVGGARRVVVS